MKITSNFDSGNINVLAADAPTDIKLSIRKDHQSDFYQWFHFKLESVAMVEHKMSIVDLRASAYPDGWKDYHAVASYDRKVWFRVDCEFDGDTLTINHTPEYSNTYYAYFAPYGYERHLDLLAWAQTFNECLQTNLGETLDGRDLSLLKISEASDDSEAQQREKKVVWITARQHPGETMAEWLIEGLLERLLDDEDGVARSLLAKCVFYIVPNMNPDGSYRGHLRTNAAGINLNREWATPSMEKSPEVYLVLNKMRETGVDLYLDIHGDEALPYNFIAGGEGNPNYSSEIADLEDAFKRVLMQITPEFQDTYGYPKDAPGQANLTIASNAVGNEFKCFACTLEMPFKDNANLPDHTFGWSPSRCKQLGEDLLIAMNTITPV
ncbi:M14 family metallopeptidase [Agarilytica rhodophyticola]|uniref:M14 family metallopeptidase n=1 Tax=Agarilytica rhodophyticola TaxID=1737490 RepID=UPI000B34180E|nr:M14-type cytosolic carboxypeptidase [Agarilytica rhodophyticola]